MRNNATAEAPPLVDCAFCAIVAGTGPAHVIRRWDDVIAIRPRGGGVTKGHVLVIPHQHVADVGVNPAISGRTMAAAAELAAELGSCNIITSRGTAATQSVFHLHIHLVPRAEGDGLLLPWSTVPAIHFTVQPDASRWNLSFQLDRSAA